MSADANADMRTLARRIDDVRNNIVTCRLVVLDSMVLGQKLSITAPPALAELLQSGNKAGPLVVLGRRGETPHNRGVTVQLESATPVPVSAVHPEGTMHVVISAQRLLEVVEVLPDDGQLWLGRRARARYIEQLDESTETAAEPSLLERSKALAGKVEIWLKLVRTTGRERAPGQIERVLADLGPMPEADQPSARALWVAGLINPLPAIGLANEVRPEALMAPSAHLRLKAVERAVDDSIKRLGGDYGI